MTALQRVRTWAEDNGHEIKLKRKDAGDRFITASSCPSRTVLRNNRNATMPWCYFQGDGRCVRGSRSGSTSTCRAGSAAGT
jgi:hypothetical protein